MCVRNKNVMNYYKNIKLENETLCISNKKMFHIYIFNFFYIILQKKLEKRRVEENGKNINHEEASK